MVSASDWLLRLMSSVMAQLTLFSVVNIPLTSLYAHRAITRDCCWEGGPVYSNTQEGQPEPAVPGRGESCSHRGDGGLLQGQAVSLPHVRVYLEHKHGDHALGGHDDHVGICYRAMHYGRAQIHWDEVELSHWEQKRNKNMVISGELDSQLGLVKSWDTFPTSFQQPNPHGGDLDDVFVVADVSCKHSRSLGGKSTRVQLHYLLTGLEDLNKSVFSVCSPATLKVLRGG